MYCVDMYNIYMHTLYYIHYIYLFHAVIYRYINYDIYNIYIYIYIYLKCVGHSIPEDKPAYFRRST